jgi:5'-methylthioadenosine phosphorylase
MIGIIGGTGLYAMTALQAPYTEEVITPFGPSRPWCAVRCTGGRLPSSPGHGPATSRYPARSTSANIRAKSLGVRTPIGVSAVGSPREEIRPGDPLPAQYLDFTKGGARRASSAAGWSRTCPRRTRAAAPRQRCWRTCARKEC